MGTEELCDNRTHTEVLALQELVCADIAFFKNQQWQAAYYGLLLYAAVAAIPKVVASPLSQWGFVILWLVSLLILLKGLYVLSELEAALKRRRNLLPFARKHFTEQALHAYGLGNPQDALRQADEKVSLKNVFMSAYVLGFLLVSWVLAIGWANA